MFDEIEQPERGGIKIVSTATLRALNRRAEELDYMSLSDEFFEECPAVNGSYTLTFAMEHSRAPGIDVPHVRAGVGVLTKEPDDFFAWLDIPCETWDALPDMEGSASTND